MFLLRYDYLHNSISLFPCILLSITKYFFSSNTSIHPNIDRLCNYDDPISHCSFKWTILGRFVFIFVFSTVNSKHTLPMTLFELQTTGVRCNCSTMEPQPLPYFSICVSPASLSLFTFILSISFPFHHSFPLMCFMVMLVMSLWQN